MRPAKSVIRITAAVLLVLILLGMSSQWIAGAMPETDVWTSSGYPPTTSAIELLRMGSLASDSQNIPRASLIGPGPSAGELAAMLAVEMLLLDGAEGQVNLPLDVK